MYLLCKFSLANERSTHLSQVITSHNKIIFAAVNVLKTCIFAENNQHIKTLINMRCVIKACNKILVLLLRLFHQQDCTVVKSLHELSSARIWQGQR